MGCGFGDRSDDGVDDEDVWEESAVTLFDGLSLAFEEAPRLWWGLPCVVLWIVYVVLQGRSHRWIGRHVAASSRPYFTVHSTRSLVAHLILLLAMAWCLVLAMAAPVLRGQGDIRPPQGAVLFLLDGSASMSATDVVLSAENSNRTSRFKLAVTLGRSLVDSLPDWSFSLVTYSGAATVHLPLTPDPVLIHDALEVVEIHNYYQSTGSRLSGALEMALAMAAQQPGLQVVLISDGEVPHDDDYEAVLTALAAQQVPVDSLAMGSYAGQTREIYDFQDVFAGRKPPRVLREYTTRRVDEHLQRISAATGGRVSTGEAASIESLAELLKGRSQDLLVTVEDRSADIDLSWIPWLFFIIGWGIDRLWIGWRPPPSPRRFDVARLGMALCLIGCQGSALEEAHRANEAGISRDQQELHDEARPHYLRSSNYQVRSHIPTYNLARSAILREDYPAAHDFFQKALQLEPRFVEAHFNDGIALYRWGAVSRDPKGCDLERTRVLWQQAKRRFDDAVVHAETDSEWAADSRDLGAAVSAALETLEKLVASPPAACQAPPSGSSGGAGSDGGGGSDSDASSDGGGSGDGGSGDGGSGDGGSGGDGDDGNAEGGGGTADQDQGSSQGSGHGDSGGDRSSDPDGGSQGQQHGDGSSSGQLGQGNSDAEGGAKRDDVGGDHSGDGSDGQPLSDAERQQVEQHLERIAAQGRSEGKYHRRSLSEQFPRSSWQNPEEIIWW